MSSNTANTNTSNYRITERHKVGIEKMREFFNSIGIRDIVFDIHIGALPDGSPHWIALKGNSIVKHLGGVLDFEVYGDDGRDILNGIRECYSNTKFQRYPLGS